MVFWTCSSSKKGPLLVLQQNNKNCKSYVLRPKVIFSLGPACGCVITLSSYNRSQIFASFSLRNVRNGKTGKSPWLDVWIQIHVNLIFFYFRCLYFLPRFERNCHKDAVLIALSNSVRPFENLIISNSKHNTKIANQCYFGEGEIIKNIAKGTTDPRVEFIFPK